MSIARTIQIEKALTDCVTDVSKLMSIAGKHGDYLREIFSLIPSYATKTELMAAVTSMKYASNREGKENQIGNILDFLGENEADKKLTEDLQRKTQNSEIAIKKLENLVKEKDRQINEMQETMESQHKQIIVLSENENLLKSKTQSMELLLRRLSEQVNNIDSRFERSMITHQYGNHMKLDSMNMSVANESDKDELKEISPSEIQIHTDDTFDKAHDEENTTSLVSYVGDDKQLYKFGNDEAERRHLSSSSGKKSVNMTPPQTPYTEVNTNHIVDNTKESITAGTIKATENDSESESDDENKTPEQTLSKVLSEILAPIIDDGSQESKKLIEAEELDRLRCLSEQQAVLLAQASGHQDTNSTPMSLELLQRFDQVERTVLELQTTMNDSINSLKYSIEQRKDREKLLLFDCERKIEDKGKFILEECVRNTHRKTSLLESRLNESNKESMIRLNNKYDQVNIDMRIVSDSLKESNSRIEYVHESLRLLDKEHSVLMSNHRSTHNMIKDTEAYMCCCIDHLITIVDTFIKNLLFAEVHKVDVMKLLEKLRIEQNDRSKK